jgi:RNA polymerase sigma-70 factor (ECF subfamily)
MTATQTTELDDDFARLADPYRRELLAHCYRMAGSLDEAEDLVQETYLRAWRAYPEFEGRASLRTWLYRIATNVCLTALAQHARRPLPSGLGAPSHDPDAPTGPSRLEVPWLQPAPDTLLGIDPATVVSARGSLRLALVAALQHLPARQRAVLLLRDVLGWPAAEVADLLDTSVPAVKSALQRARAQLRSAAPDEDQLTEPADPDRRALLDRYATAFQNADLAGLVRLLRADAVLEMPPVATWFTGRDTVARFLTTTASAPNGVRLVPTGANGQPALADYRRDADGVFRAHGIHVFTVRGGLVARMTAFLDPGLFPRFGLPLVG